jgi:hypothetical protein
MARRFLSCESLPETVQLSTFILTRKPRWSYAARGVNSHRGTDRSKHYSTPLVGIVREGNETHVAPCLAAGKLVTNLFDLIGDWVAVADALTPGEPSESIDDVEIL